MEPRKKTNRATPYEPFPGPVVVKCEEKHETLVFVAMTEAQLHAIALDILATRFRRGEYKPSERLPEKPEKVDPRVLNDLPGYMKREYKARMRRYEEVERAFIEFENIKRAVEEQDGFQAIELLKQRSDWDYEHVSFDTPPPVPNLIPRPENPSVGRVWCDPETGERWQWEGKRWVPHTYVRLEHNAAAADGNAPLPPQGFVERSPF